MRDVLTVVHGMVFTVWVALFLTQASLISVGNVALQHQCLSAMLFARFRGLTRFAAALVVVDHQVVAGLGQCNRLGTADAR